VVMTMNVRSWVSALVLGAVLTLRTLAYASPPDPSWLAGFWDDADYDDIVIRITSTFGIADTHPYFDPGPPRPIGVVVSAPEEDAAPTKAFSPYHPRDPPVSDSFHAI